MAYRVLDRSENYLEIFCEKIEIDKNLPKWKHIKEKQEKLDEQALKDAEKLLEEGEETETDLEVLSIEKSNKIDEGLSQEISFQELSELSAEDFNLFVSKRIISQTYKNSYIGMENPWMGGEKEQKESTNFIKKGIRQVVKYFKSYTDSSEEEEAVQFNAIEFFDEIKKLVKEQQPVYVNRIKPFMIALQQANDMGQKALSDKLVSEIFRNKYESLLYASNFRYIVTEEQAVFFIKRAEKGVRIDYIKNFARPIPEEVQKKKKEADKLEIFDNYVIMHFDPELKSYKQTKAEEEELRRRRRDPIMFGVIYSHRLLYYITDWHDDYCDLTLDKFVEVAGLNKKSLEISEKIKL